MNKLILFFSIICIILMPIRSGPSYFLIEKAHAQSLQDLLGNNSGSSSTAAKNGMTQEQLNSLLSQIQANDTAKKQQQSQQQAAQQQAQSQSQQAAAQQSQQQTTAQTSAANNSSLSFLNIMILVIEFITFGLLWVFLIIASTALWKYVNQKNVVNPDFTNRANTLR